MTFRLSVSPPTENYTLSLHDALPIYLAANGQAALERLQQEPRIGLVITDVHMVPVNGIQLVRAMRQDPRFERSEEHTSELQSQSNLVCRLLLEKKKSMNENHEKKNKK